eukprot:gnl/TRDRNA2_/TRDRNA2_47875_c0_seq1.p1 gnl/TRDRNA2_/TRDRNA2_47875_c0~~gnl/TRDRNA2_/TRDRNA2_47875_c0_seq1.p1  ORF type:complete len:362 (-),score=120.83 gnl/TRDRNA2_/TRDRNA2_47875_c0_seq1:77-1162(-)
MLQLHCTWFLLIGLGAAQEKCFSDDASAFLQLKVGALGAAGLTATDGHVHADLVAQRGAAVVDDADFDADAHFAAQLQEQRELGEEEAAADDSDFDMELQEQRALAQEEAVADDMVLDMELQEQSALDEDEAEAEDANLDTQLQEQSALDEVEASADDADLDVDFQEQSDEAEEEANADDADLDMDFQEQSDKDEEEANADDANFDADLQEQRDVSLDEDKPIFPVLRSAVDTLKMAMDTSPGPEEALQPGSVKDFVPAMPKLPNDFGQLPGWTAGMSVNPDGVSKWGMSQGWFGTKEFDVDFKPSPFGTWRFLTAPLRRAILRIKDEAKHLVDGMEEDLLGLKQDNLVLQKLEEANLALS